MTALGASVGLLSDNTFAAPAGAQVGGPGTVLLNGSIDTVNAKQPWAQAVAVRGDRIVRGTNKGARAFIGKGTRAIDLKGSPASLPVIRATKAITLADIARTLPRILEGLSEYGFTAAMDFGNPIATEAAAQAAVKLDQQGRLPRRLMRAVMPGECARTTSGSTPSRSLATAFWKTRRRPWSSPMSKTAPSQPGIAGRPTSTSPRC